MSTTGERIKQCRLNAGMTQTELADKIGVKFSAIHKYETGLVVNLKRETIEKLAIALNVRPSYLMCMDDDPNPGMAEDASPNIAEKFVTFPIIAESAAGYDCYAEYEDYTSGEIDIPISWLKGRPMSDYFVIKVHGDSMFPAYQDGDLVLVLKQTTFNYSGQIGVVVYDDIYGTLKRVEYVYGEDWMRLVPINPAYPPVMVTDERLEHCRVLGIAKMVIREIK